MKRHLLVSLVCLWICSPPALQAMEPQKPTFQFGETRLDLVDTMAWREEVGEARAQVTIVLMADFEMDRADLLAAISAPDALLQQTYQREGNGNFVLITLREPGKCGVFAYLGGERPQHVGLSDSFPAETRNAGASRASGVCYTAQPGKMFDDVYEFRLTYDVPLTAMPKATVLAAGGGEPGRALVALAKAIETKDWSVAKLHLEVEQSNRTPDNLDHFFDSLSLNYPKGVEVTEGLIKGDRARLEIRGLSHDGKKLRGTFEMKKADGSWRVAGHALFYDE